MIGTSLEDANLLEQLASLIPVYLTYYKYCYLAYLIVVRLSGHIVRNNHALAIRSCRLRQPYSRASADIYIPVSVRRKLSQGKQGIHT